MACPTQFLLYCNILTYEMSNSMLQLHWAYVSHRSLSLPHMKLACKGSILVRSLPCAGIAALGTERAIHLASDIVFLRNGRDYFDIGWSREFKTADSSPPRSS